MLASCTPLPLLPTLPPPSLPPPTVTLPPPSHTLKTKHKFTSTGHSDHHTSDCNLRTMSLSDALLYASILHREQRKPHCQVHSGLLMVSPRVNIHTSYCNYTLSWHSISNLYWTTIHWSSVSHAQKQLQNCCTSPVGLVTQ